MTLHIEAFSIQTDCIRMHDHVLYFYHDGHIYRLTEGNQTKAVANFTGVSEDVLEILPLEGGRFAIETTPDQEHRNRDRNLWILNGSESPYQLWSESDSLMAGTTSELVSATLIAIPLIDDVLLISIDKGMHYSVDETLRAKGHGMGEWMHVACTYSKHDGKLAIGYTDGYDSQLVLVDCCKPGSIKVIKSCFLPKLAVAAVWYIDDKTMRWVSIETSPENQYNDSADETTKIGGTVGHVGPRNESLVTRLPHRTVFGTDDSDNLEFEFTHLDRVRPFGRRSQILMPSKHLLEFSFDDENQVTARQEDCFLRSFVQAINQFGYGIEPNGHLVRVTIGDDDDATRLAVRSPRKIKARRWPKRIDIDSHIEGIVDSHRKSKSKSLQIYDIPLKSIPLSVFSLEWLTEMTFMNVQLQEVGSEISNLKQLKDLSLYFNRLKSVPESLGQLPELLEICLKCNPLEELPEGLFLAPKLRRINAINTSIRSLPESMIACASLRHLAIGSKYLREIPPWLYDLPLESLAILDSPIDHLSEDIEKLSTLNFLMVEGTNISTLPDSIANLSMLTTLDVSKTKITHIPDTVFQLPKLEQIIVEGIELHQSIPKFAIESQARITCKRCYNIDRTQ